MDVDDSVREVWDFIGFRVSIFLDSVTEGCVGEVETWSFTMHAAREVSMWKRIMRATITGLPGSTCDPAKQGTSLLNEVIVAKLVVSLLSPMSLQVVSQSVFVSEPTEPAE